MFDIGHQIRLEVASSNFPAFDRSSGTRQAPHEAAWGDMRMAVQTVFHSEKHPSQLHLHELQD